MLVRRHDDRNRIARLAQFVERSEPPAVVLRANFLCTRVIRLENAGELGAGQRRINARMVLAERPDADDAAFDFVHGLLFSVHGWDWLNFRPRASLDARYFIS